MQLFIVEICGGHIWESFCLNMRITEIGFVTLKYANASLNIILFIWKEKRS
jgi:hypothetical protein